MSVGKFKGKKSVAFCSVLKRVYAKRNFKGGKLVWWWDRNKSPVSAVKYGDLLLTTDGVRIFNTERDKIELMSSKSVTSTVYRMCSQFVSTHYPCVLLNEYCLVTMLYRQNHVASITLAEKLKWANLRGGANNNSRITQFYFTSSHRWRCRHVMRRVQQNDTLNEFILTPYLVVGVSEDTVTVKRYINLNNRINPYYKAADESESEYPEVILKLSMQEFKYLFARGAGWRKN